MIWPVNARSGFAGFRPFTLLLGYALLSLVPRASALDPGRAVRDYRVTEWGMANGLPYPSVAALAQSPDGYLWVGTRMGLSRFDGVTFTTFTHANRPELGDDRITTLFVASDRTMWIGTLRGVAWYRDGVWSHPTLHPVVDHGEIAGIGETADGAIFVSHSIDRANSKDRSSGLFYIKDGKCTEVRLPGGGEFPRVSDVNLLPGGETFLTGRGIFRERQGKIVDVTRQLRSENIQILAATIQRDGSIWLASQLGLNHWSGETCRSFSTVDGLPSNSVRSLALDRDENLWIGTSNGLARYNEDGFQPLLLHGVESLSNVLSLFEDAERNLWVGTDNGLYRVQDVKVATFGQRDGLPVNPTLCVLRAKDGTQWVGTIGGGLAHITADGVKTLRMKDGLKEESIGALAEDNEGGLWIAYYTRGLSYYRDGKFSHFNPGEPVRFRGLSVDANGGVWAASSDGLFRLANGQFERVPIDAALQYPRGLHIGRDGSLWILSARAFGRWRDGKWSLFRKPAETEAQVYQYLFTDSRGDTWVLQDGPLVIRLHDDQQQSFAFPGLGPLIYSGFEHAGELWINFRAGVVRIPLAEFDAVSKGRKSQPAYTLFSEADGMRSRAPNNIGYPGATVTRDGTLWFPTSMGIAKINPAHIRRNLRPPPVRIERVLADKTEIAPTELKRIAPGRGEVAFEFAGLSFVNPSQVRFKYRLVGFDPTWVEAGNSRTAHYGGLSPREYRFEVTACNDEGVWSSEPASVDLVLLPHFYQKWWFFVLLGVAAINVGMIGSRWRSRQLKRQAAELERENDALERHISERTNELRQSYEALRESEYFYHSLVESLPQVIVRKDADGRYTYANAAASELFGRPLGEMIGRTDRELFPEPVAEKAMNDDERILRQRQPMEYEEILERDGRKRYLHVKRVPLFDGGGQPLGVQLLFWDMTVFRETEGKLRTAQRELVEISRLAGIAEMATGVLHNLGNAVNSVKVAATVAHEMVSRSEVTRLRRVAEMLRNEQHRLPEFFAQDARAAKLPHYLTLLSDELENERREIMRELQQLGLGIEHVAQIIAAQQDGARVGGIIETVSPKELVEYACRMNADVIERHGVSVVREFMPAADISIDRQKALQILANLVRNAIEAMAESGRPDKRLLLRVDPAGEDVVEISVTDNGVGIVTENLLKIFEFGFTTKRNGHGFGLHNSATTAQQIGGNLRAESDGPGTGATFTLRLPLTPSRSSNSRSPFPLRTGSASR